MAGAPPAAGPAIPAAPFDRPHPGYVPPVWFGPGPGLSNPCNDRGNHAYPPPPASCTSTALGTINAVQVGLGLPGGPITLPQYGQLPCDNHAGVHTVCYHCNRMSKNLTWYKQAAARIMRLPPPPAAETNAWRGFLTRMCQRCERSEQYLIYSRLPGAAFIVPTLPPPPAVQARMYDYPRNTCTCMNRLKEGRLCRADRRAHWDNLRAGMVALRNHNKTWLFETAAFPTPANPWHLRTASPARRQNRIALAAGHLLRGCRCGREVTNAPPAVWQCLVCEGIIEAAASLTAVWVAANPPTPIHLTNSASVGTPLQMNRPRSVLTI